MTSLLVLTVVCVVQLACAQTFRPAVVPLSQKSPYFNTWLGYVAEGNDRSSEDNIGVQSWLGKDLGHTGLIRLDGNIYAWLNRGGVYPSYPFADLVDVKITPTSTSLIMEANKKMNITVTFLSPIEIDDMVLQSYPFMYIYLELTSTDGEPHDVQLYMDVSGRWLSNDDENSVKCSTEVPLGSGPIYHQVTRVDPDSWKEGQFGLAEDSTLYLGTEYEPGTVTYNAYHAVEIRNRFALNGTLGNVNAMATGRPINKDFPVFALAKTLGNITRTEAPTVFTLGVARNPVIKFTPGPNQQAVDLAPVWASKYQTAGDGITPFLSGFNDARQRAASVDGKIVSSAQNVSSELANLIALTTRSVVASMELTYANNVSDILVFVKAMGSNNDQLNSVFSSQCTDLYAAWPSIIYLNGRYGGYILEPLLRYQSSMTGHQSALSSLGNKWPVVSGDATNTSVIENSSSMLLMTWAHARFTGDTELVKRHYSTLKRWADYLTSLDLVNTPSSQSSDSIRGDDQANLALQGILAVRAMGELARLQQEDESVVDGYIINAKRLLSKWVALALGTDHHVKSKYNDEESWTMPYNLFQDRWLGFNMGDQLNIYDTETRYLQTSTQHNNANGRPFNSESEGMAKSHWTLWTAAYMTDNQVRDDLISQVHRRMADHNQPELPSTSYNTDDGGEGRGGQASPVFGAYFAPLAINMQPNISAGDAAYEGDDTIQHRSNTGSIAGGVVGGVAAIILLLLAIFFVRRRRRQSNSSHDSSRELTPQSVTPYNYQAVSAELKSGTEHDRPSRFGNNLVPEARIVGVMSKRRQNNHIATHPTTSTPAVSSSSDPSSSAGQQSSQTNAGMREAFERLQRDMEEMREATGAFERLPRYSERL